MHLRAAAIQFAATPLNCERNLQVAEGLVRQAAAQGAQLALLPELFNTGYVYARRLPDLAEDESGPTLGWLRALGAELGLHLGGSLLMRRDGRIHNVLALAEPGGRLHYYAKQHPFMWERCFFSAGSRPLIAETDLGRLGLMVCWDVAQPACWQAFAGRVEAVLVASSPPRLHRAVLNFPLGRKVYAAQLAPALLRRRAEMDAWYAGAVGQRAAWLGAPVVHAVMAGRFATQVPLPRLSFAAAAIARPRYWPLVPQAHLATLRASFYASSAVYDGLGRAVAQADGEAGLAIADLELAPHRSPGPDRPLPALRLPLAVRSLDWLLRLAARVRQ
jgi:predicted amidohydrolase